MNLEESNSYNQEIESRDRKRRAVMLSIILCGVFIALLFVMIIIISYQDSITEKFYIDGVQIKSFNNSMYTQIDGVTYVDVRTLSSALGYTYTKGEYKKYNEDENGEYELLKLQERVKARELPSVYTIDMRQELKEGNKSAFSAKLHELMEERLAKREQIMLFLNRRGYLRL